MITSVQISNLRGIQQGELKDLSPLTILVGPNGCGKSTLLEGLYLGSHPYPPEALGQIVARRGDVVDGAIWLVWRKEIHHSVSVAVAVEAPGSRGGRRCVLEFEPPDKDEIARILCRVRPPNGQVPVSFQSDNSYRLLGRAQFASVLPYVRLSDALSPSDQPLHDLFSAAVHQGRRAQVIGVLSDLLADFRDLTILTENGAPLLHVEFGTHSVPVSLAGDGVHRLVRVALELAACPSGLVLLEEPEAHQHPASLRQCVRVIWSAVRRNVQVILTTHSLELIDTLVAEMKDDDLDRLSLYRVKLDEGRLIAVRLTGREVERARTQIQDDLR